jgi:glycosyltransferase involved in cell wall biosynthesis
MAARPEVRHAVVVTAETGVPEVPLRGVSILHVTTVAKTFGFLEGQVRFMGSRGADIYSAAGEARGIPKNWPIPFSTVEMRRRITPVRDLIAIWQLFRMIGRINPNIVQGHTPKGALLAMIAATISRVPIRIFQVHGLPHVAARGVRRVLLVLATRVSCMLANKVFCVSNSARKILVEEALCPPHKAVVLGNGSSGGVDLRRFDPEVCSLATGRAFRQALSIPGTAVLAGFAGRIVRDKGIAELAQAWLTLRAQFPDLHLVIAGEAEDQDPIPADAREILKSDPRIHLIGRCQEIPQFYSACDLIVLPTYREGFPNVVLEAGAMGIPTVATRVPGCTDAVVDGVTGTLVAPHDPAELAAAIARYVADPGLRRLHGTAARTRVLRDFRPRIIHDDVYRHYCDLLGHPARTGACMD